MSKEEIQELESEIKRLKNLLRLRDDPSPVSPLAPKGGFPNLPEIGGGGEIASARQLCITKAGTTSCWRGHQCS